MNNAKTVKEPLFHVVKRSNIPVWKKLSFYAVSVVAALILAALFCSVSSSTGGFFDFFTQLFNGVLGTERRIWLFLRDGALLLGVALALLPAFKMKFWNLGANGQIVISCLVSYAIMFYAGQNAGWSNAAVIIVMIIASIAASVIWAVIPAIFKAYFNTNETLFTLMMNYIAQGLVLVMIKAWAPTGSGSLSPISGYGLIDIVNPYLLTLIVITLVTVFSYFYLAKSKHGYELSVVGESINTARYAGMNVKKIIIRTMVVSGIMCGIVGVLLTGGINHTVSDTIHSNMGFTAIIATWLAHFDPLISIGTCYLITFISSGMGQVKIFFHFYDNSISNVVIGFIYFFIIACSFFISYKLIFRKKNKAEPIPDFTEPAKTDTETKAETEEVKSEEPDIQEKPEPVDVKSTDPIISETEVKEEIKEEKSDPPSKKPTVKKTAKPNSKKTTPAKPVAKKASAQAKKTSSAKSGAATKNRATKNSASGNANTNKKTKSNGKGGKN